MLYWKVYSWKTLDPVTLESRAAEPAPQLSDRPQSRARRKSSSQGTSDHLCSREPPHTTLFPPTAGRRACLGLPLATEQCRYPVTDFYLQALGSKQAQTGHHLFTSPRAVNGSCWLHTSRQTGQVTASQRSGSSGHSGPALSNGSVLYQPTWSSSRSRSISSDHTPARQKEPGAGRDTVDARVVPRVVMSSAACILLRPCWASPHFLLQAAQASNHSQALSSPKNQLEHVRTEPF